MSIHELTRVVSPPRNPIGIGDASRWRQIEKRLGLKLPKDLRDFGVVYGSGRFFCTHVYISVFNPFEAVYPDRVLYHANIYREIRDRDESDPPYGIFPESPGLLPWGHDDNGSSLCWLTGDEPDRWPIIVNPAREREYQRFDLPLTTFLAQAFTRALSCIVWEEPEFFSSRVVFEVESETESPSS